MHYQGVCWFQYVFLFAWNSVGLPIDIIDANKLQYFQNKPTSLDIWCIRSMKIIGCRCMSQALCFIGFQPECYILEGTLLWSFQKLSIDTLYHCFFGAGCYHRFLMKINLLSSYMHDLKCNIRLASTKSTLIFHSKIRWSDPHNSCKILILTDYNCLAYIGISPWICYYYF